MPSPKDLGQELKAQRTASYQWMLSNFYDQWEQVFKSYKCERDPVTDPNKPDEIDPSYTSIGMPDTFALINRQAARVTSQSPNIRFRADDQELGARISRKLMYDWDRGKAQRTQKKHTRQACMFGWSVKGWGWESLEYPRMKRVDPLSSGLDEDTRGMIQDQYSDQLGDISQQHGVPPDDPVALTHLLAGNSRGGLLPITYNYKKYEGPKSDFIFIGDCFPQPNFQTLQSSGYFIVRRRRNRSWIDALTQRYPELAPTLEKLLTAYPKGNQNNFLGKEDQNLRQKMFTAVNRVDETSDDRSESTAEWSFYERHIPGENAKLAYIGEDDMWIGEIPYPYDLEGRIAFSELTLIDDLLCGIGDSHARILRGLQILHDRQVNVRFDLIYNILRPLVGTTDQQLYENPELIKRANGFRLVKLQNAGSFSVLGEQAAIAAAAAGLQDDEAIARIWQSASGESNMSQSANLDPQQTRTATGARLLAYNQDILSKDMNDMLLATCLSEDAEIMYHLNRSEMPESVSFNASPYNRDYASPQPTQQSMTVSPHDFQFDGEVEAEAGSTLADDDDSKMAKAQLMLQTAATNPHLNIRTAVIEWLIANGKGRELDKWLAPPPPPPPPSEPLRESLTVSLKFETLAPEVQMAILQKANIQPPPGMVPPPPGTPLATPPAPAGGTGSPPAPPPPPSEAMGPAVLAAEGKLGPPRL